MAPAMRATYRVAPAPRDAPDFASDDGAHRHLPHSLSARMDRWHQRAEKKKRASFEGWLLRQQGLLTTFFTFFVFCPSFAYFFKYQEDWDAWDSHVAPRGQYVSDGNRRRRRGWVGSASRRLSPRGDPRGGRGRPPRALDGDSLAAGSATRRGGCRRYVFVFTVITTIGYGNFSPTTTRGMYATILMGLVGIPLTCYALAWIGTCSIHVSHALLKWGRRRLGLNDKPSKSTEIIFSAFIFVLHFFHCVLVFAVMEGWTLTVSAYYTFVTLSTIGLGDKIALYYKKNSDDEGMGRRRLQFFGWSPPRRRSLLLPPFADYPRSRAAAAPRLATTEGLRRGGAATRRHGRSPPRRRRAPRKVLAGTTRGISWRSFAAWRSSRSFLH